MRVATAAYPMDVLTSWESYENKLRTWVRKAVADDAQLLVFPEYGAMELATLAGREVAFDLEQSLHAVSERMPEANAILSGLAQEFGVFVLGPSGPVFDADISDRPVNRAHILAPDGRVAHQDKQIMTRFERETWGVVGGGSLTLFDTPLGKIAVLICYDSEFPLLGRAVAEADVVLVPSCTEALTGYSRVRIGAMARALENQCVTVMSSTVGACDWSQAVDENTGMGGVFGSPDTGFPATGVIAEGELNMPGWTFTDIDLDKIAHVRADGVVLNRAHWAEQDGRDVIAATCKLG